MLFEIKNCKILEVTGVTSGTSQAGKDWTKATVVIEQADGNYTETYALQAFDDKVDAASARVGHTVDIKFTIRAREYNGRWFNDLRVQYVADVAQAAKPQQQAAKPAPAPEKEDSPDNDLPF